MNPRVQRVDRARVRSYHRDMPMWRCPHCGTPQAETARCWVCRRSSTACGTCKNFRRSVAGSLGYCGLDRAREPLAGDEIRACWEAGPGVADLTLIAPLTIVAAADGAATPPVVAGPRVFIAVDDGAALHPAPGPAIAVAERGGEAGEPDAPPPDPLPALVQPAAEAGWSLWGDVDR